MAYQFVGADPIYEQVKRYMEFCQMVRRMSPATLETKKLCYKQFIEQSGCKDLDTLTNQEFNQFVKMQTLNGIAPRTVNMRVGNLIALFKWHKEMGGNMSIKLPLIQKLKEGSVRRVFYTREEIALVLSRLDLKAKNEWVRRDNLLDWLLIKVCFDAGLRISELRNLELRNFTGKRINFVGKGFKPGEAYVSEETFLNLEEWKRIAGVTKWLWVSEHGRHLGVDELRVRMRKAFAAVGFTDFYPHALRHSFCTDLQRQGATMEEMQQMLRHSDLKTTEIYSHGLEGQKEALFRKYRDLDSKKSTIFGEIAKKVRKKS